MGESTGVIEAWQKAFLAQDADAIAELYTEDAIFTMPALEIVAKGRPAIRDAWKALEGMGKAESVEIIERDEVISGDVAYAHQHGVIRGTDPEGQPMEIPFRTTEVMRRGDDGNWRYVIDHG
jgi:uncharacterized protein (TIGR02246 family)